MPKTYSIAIDGPAGAGKSTMAKTLAKELGFYYVDTGAIYRTVAYFMDLLGVSPKDVDGVERYIDELTIGIEYDEEGKQHMIMNGMDVTDEIRTPEISQKASLVSAHAMVRDMLLDMQRDVAKKNNARLISPALNWGTLPGYSNGVQWLQEFFTLVNPNDVHGIAVHIYMNAAKSMIGDLQRYKVFGKPLWLTEFCAWDGTSSSAAQCQFMAQSINYLEQDDDLERYAWFIPRWNQATESAPFMQLITKAKPYELTERGILFVNMSTFDKNAVYPCGKRIPAEHYRACSIDDSYASPVVSICTDVNGILQIDGLALNQWMDYKINILSGVKDFQIRYTATRDSEITIYKVDENGNETALQTIALPSTASKTAWTTLTESFTPEAGEQVLRLKCTKGLPRINWFKLK